MTALLPTPDLLCEIHADRSHVSDLREIVAICARDIGLSVSLKTHTQRLCAGEEALITLHLPAETAAAQHPAWCLACRLACFCPRARVSVLIRSEAIFQHPQPRRRRSA